MVDFRPVSADKYLMQFRIKKVDRAFALFILSFACLAAALTVSLWPKTEDVDVLRSPSPQAVHNDYMDFPSAAPLGETWEVEGQKCNDSDRPVRVVGEISWNSINPSGSPLVAGSYTSDLNPGCTILNFRNVIPENVEFEMEAQLVHLALNHDPLEPVVWRITGTEEIAGYVECFPEDEAAEHDEFNLGVITHTSVLGGGFGVPLSPVCPEGEASVVTEEVTNSAASLWFSDNVAVYSV